MKENQFQQVLEVSRMLAVTTELDALLDHIAHACCSMLDCERASIFLHDDTTHELWTKVAVGSKEIRVSEHAGMAGHVFKSNQLLHCPKPYDDPRFNPEPDRRTGFVTRNLLTAPMVDVDRKPVGVIQAVNKKSSDDFDGADESMIQLLADQSGVAIQRFHLQQSAIEAAALRHEMNLARIVQEAMIPKNPPQIPGLQSIGWTRSASINGGDCFDLWRLSDGRLGIFLGDASGHGIAPALVVSQARTLIRALCELNPDPHQLLSITNARLHDDLEPGRFVTAFVGILDRDGTLHWSSAGHGPVLVRRSPNSAIETLEPPGPPLGVMPEFLADPAEPIHLDPQGTLLVMSDGIFEAFDPARQQFGADAVEKIFNDLSTAPIADLLNRIRADVQCWQQKIEPADDQTLVIARRS